jgi:hypothetical protein
LTGCVHLSEAATEETAAATVMTAATIEAAAVKMAKTAEADIRKRRRQW